MFDRYIGIDYSGARGPSDPVTGLQVYVATPGLAPQCQRPPSTIMSEASSASQNWSRRGLCAWLVSELSKPTRTIVGIDHGFSFPDKYFEVNGLSGLWPEFLEDFCRHWSTETESVNAIRDRAAGTHRERSGDPGWLRLTERRATPAKSVFNFHGAGVAFSTHAGLPWLRRLRAELAQLVHFWPFDDWEVAAGKSVVAEVYPSLWRAIYAPEDRKGDAHDAFCVAAWLRDTDAAGYLPKYFDPLLSDGERRQARREGWILGVGIKA